MYFLQILFFFAAGAGVGFVVARFLPGQADADPTAAVNRWRTEAENVARERDQLQVELDGARREIVAPAEIESRFAHLKSALQKARRRIEELERDQEAVAAAAEAAAAGNGAATGREPTAREGAIDDGIAPPRLAAPEGKADDLKRINGIGPGVERSLNELGIWHYRQIAALAPGHVTWLDRRLPVKGRIVKQDWIAQARALADGPKIPAKELEGATAA